MNVPFTGLVMKEVPAEGDTINGQFIPGGTRIGQNFLAVQRSTAVFGNDAEMFRPERWLNIEDTQLNQWKQHVELVFGSGRWGCSGKAVAFMELNKVYVEVSDSLIKAATMYDRGDNVYNFYSFYGVSISN